MTLRVLANWCPEALRRVLQEEGIRVDVVDIRYSLTKFLSYGDDYDLYYFARFAPPLVDPSIAGMRLKNRRLIYAFHSPLTIDYPVRPSHYVYNMLMPVQALEIGLHAIIHVLNVTDYAIARSLGLRNLLYLPLGTDTEVFKPSRKEDEFTVIYASRASWHKGTDILCNYIIPILVKKMSDVRIRIVSYGFLTYLYKPLSNLKNIEILTHMPLHEYAQVLSRSHVLLFPSRYESYGLVVLDALASGVIPVVFNVRGFVRDVLMRSNAFRKFVVDYPSVGSFIKTVIGLYNIYLKSPEEYQHLVIEARRLAINYSWQNIGRLYSQIFKEIVSGSPR